MHVLVLADDLTGALEIGAHLAEAGLPAIVEVSPEANSELPLASGVLVLDIETRHLASEDAGQRVFRLAQAARALGVVHLYLKTDSTLRGPIAAQIQALLDAWSERALVYAPAYPALGRQVAGGKLWVEGRPLADTPFANDPLCPSREGDILKLLEQGCRASVLHVSSAIELRERLEQGIGGSIVVCDAWTEDELHALAAVLAPLADRILLAGTGGLARYWARWLQPGGRKRPIRLRARRWLVVNGSLHPRSREQVEISGLPRIQDDVTAGTGFTWAVLSAPAQRSESPSQVAARLGQAAASIVGRSGVDGLVVFGGDTTREVLKALGVSRLEARGELLPGVPVSELPAARLVLVSKAGGFGPPDILCKIREAVERCR